MFKLNSKLMTGAVLTSALLAGCGGDSGGYASTGPTQPMDQTITAVADYIRNLIASNGENTEPIDINGLTLATDDTSEPAPVN
ncbi:MAG: hypothetical protein ABIR13_09780 [Polaromonas sp.]